MVVNRKGLYAGSWNKCRTPTPLPPFPSCLSHTCLTIFALIAPFSLACLKPMPNKCVCGADATVSVAELGDALRCAPVAMYPRCPTICTTCFHIIQKGALPALEPTLSVSAEEAPRPPTVCPSHATGHAPSGSLDNGSTAGSANNNSTEATVEDPDVEFAPLHRQVFATRTLASHAARTVVDETLSGVTAAVALVRANTDLRLAEMHGIPPTFH